MGWDGMGWLFVSFRWRGGGLCWCEWSWIGWRIGGGWVEGEGWRVKGRG